VIDLDGWIALRELTLDQAREKLGVDGEPGVRYERLRPVRRLHNAAVHPGHFYFDGNHQVMQYVGAAGLEGVDPAELERRLGGPGEILHSRAGKSSVMHVYADRGVAFSSDGHEVELLELFPPTTFEDYRRRIYEDPGAFIK
jgi:hypothetical protein